MSVARISRELLRIFLVVMSISVAFAPIRGVAQSRSNPLTIDCEHPRNRSEAAFCQDDEGLPARALPAPQPTPAPIVSSPLPPPQPPVVSPSSPAIAAPAAEGPAPIDRDLPENAGLTPERLAALQVANQQARACVRTGLSAAYQAGMSGAEEAYAFFQNRCGAPYRSAYSQADPRAADMATTLLKLIVFQELYPGEWEKFQNDLARAAKNK